MANLKDQNTMVINKLHNIPKKEILQHLISNKLYLQNQNKLIINMFYSGSGIPQKNVTPCKTS